MSLFHIKSYRTYEGAAAYQRGNTGSRTITEVKQRLGRLVLGWEIVLVLPDHTVANP